MVRAHAIYVADSSSIPAGGPCCMSHPPLSAIVPICLLLNKGVYAKKKKMTVGQLLKQLQFGNLSLLQQGPAYDPPNHPSS